jgi:hypothetical protein
MVVRRRDPDADAAPPEGRRRRLGVRAVARSVHDDGGAVAKLPVGLASRSSVSVLVMRSGSRSIRVAPTTPRDHGATPPTMIVL